MAIKNPYHFWLTTLAVIVMHSQTFMPFLAQVVILTLAYLKLPLLAQVIIPTFGNPESKFAGFGSTQA